MNVPNAITLLGAACGLTVCATASRLDLRYGLILIAAAVVLDRLDGLAARRLGQSSELGAQLDSLADVTSFGVAPAVLMVTHGPVWMLAPALVYGLAAVWRLAAFHHVGLVDTLRGPAFIGLPTTAAAAWLVVATVALHQLAPAAAFVGEAVALVVLAAWMVSPLRYPKNGPILVVLAVLLLVSVVVQFVGG